MFGRTIRATARSLYRVTAILLVVELIARCTLWSFGPHVCIEPDPETGWKVRPNLQKVFNSADGPYVIETNSRGMRDAEHSYEHTGNSYRIVALGACGTFGLGVDERETYVSQLEELVPNSETINLAAIGFSADQQFIQLQNVGLRYQPDLVIQFLIKQDGRSTFYPFVSLFGPKPHLTCGQDQVSLCPPTPELWSQALSLTHLPIVASRFDAWNSALYSDSLPSNEARFRIIAQLLLQTQKLCHDAGVDYLAVYVPEIANVATFELYGKDSFVLIPRLLDYLQNEGQLSGVNLMSAVSDAQSTNTENPVFSPGDGRLSARGHSVVAQRVAEAVKARPTFQAIAKRDGIASVAENDAP